MPPISQRAWALALAGGCAAWVGLAFGRTERMAEMIGAEPAEVRALGARDVVSGLALALSPHTGTTIATRVAFDLADAVRYGPGRPKVIAMTAGFAAFGAIGLLLPRD